MVKKILEHNKNGMLPRRRTNKHAKLHRVKHLVEGEVSKVRKVWRVVRHPLEIGV